MKSEEKVTITYFLRVKDGKKFKTKEFQDLATLNEARREAEKDGTFLGVGAYCS